MTFNPSAFLRLHIRCNLSFQQRYSVILTPNIKRKETKVHKNLKDCTILKTNLLRIKLPIALNWSMKSITSTRTFIGVEDQGSFFRKGYFQGYVFPNNNFVEIRKEFEVLSI